VCFSADVTLTERVLNECREQATSDEAPSTPGIKLFATFLTTRRVGIPTAEVARLISVPSSMIVLPYAFTVEQKEHTAVTECFTSVLLNIRFVNIFRSISLEILNCSDDYNE
jgi:hypothetical protein